MAILDALAADLTSVKTKADSLITTAGNVVVFLQGLQKQITDLSAQLAAAINVDPALVAKLDTVAQSIGTEIDSAGTELQGAISTSVGTPVP